MTTQPIVDFLLARIAEDEAAAPKVCMWVTFTAGDGYRSIRTDDLSARVLAECQAKRAIIEHWDDSAEFPDYDGGYQTAVENILCDLAVVYADHPDYQQEWKP